MIDKVKYIWVIIPNFEFIDDYCRTIATYLPVWYAIIQWGRCVMTKTIIEAYTCGNSAFDTIDDRCLQSEEYVARSFCILPRGYKELRDSSGRRYILCPNGAKVYELEQHKRDTKAYTFVYDVDGRMRRVRMPIISKREMEMLYHKDEE